MIRARTLGTGVVLLVVTGCGAGPAGSTSPDAAPPSEVAVEAPSLQEPKVDPDPGDGLSVQQILSSARLIIAGRVAVVEAPIWNQESGEEWVPAVDEPGLFSPARYQWITVDVGEVLHGTDAKSGEQFRFILLTPPDDPERVSEPDGRVDVEKDDELVVALTYSYFPMRDEVVDRWYPLGRANAVFVAGADGDYTRTGSLAPTELVDPPAFDVVSEGSVSLDALRELVELSRSADLPRWPEYAEPMNAEEYAAYVDELIARLREEVEATLSDPTNVCNFVGDAEKVNEYITTVDSTRHTKAELMDPDFYRGLCDGFEAAE